MMEPLHLTEENRAAIRSFVTEHFPKWNEEATVDHARERVQRQLHEAVDLAAATRKAFAPQLATNIYNTSPVFQQLMNQASTQASVGALSNTLYGVPSRPFLDTSKLDQKAWAEAMKSGKPTYVPFGQVFDPYNGT